MASFVQIVGNLVRDPELVHDQNGAIQCRYTVAVDNGKKPDGTTDTNFYDCKLYGLGADFFFKHSQKGTRVLVSGRMKASESVREYEEKMEDGSVVKVRSSKQRLKVSVSTYELLDKMRDWPPIPATGKVEPVATAEGEAEVDDTI